MTLREIRSLSIQTDQMVNALRKCCLSLLLLAMLELYNTSFLLKLFFFHDWPSAPHDGEHMVLPLLK